MKRHQILPYSVEFSTEFERDWDTEEAEKTEDAAETEETKDLELGNIDEIDATDVTDATDATYDARSSSSNVSESQRISSLINLFTLDFYKESDQEGFASSDFLIGAKLNYVRCLTVLFSFGVLTNILDQEEPMSIITNAIIVTCFISLFVTSFIAEKTPTNTNRIVIAFMCIVLLVAAQIIFFSIPGLPKSIHSAETDSTNHGQISIIYYMICVHMLITNIFAPWKYILPSSFVFIIVYFTFLGIQLTDTETATTLRVGFIYYVLCAVCKYFLELYQKYTFIAMQKSELLVHLLDASPNISFVVDASKKVYWGNQMASTILGMIENKKSSMDFALNAKLRRKFTTFSLTTKDMPIFSNPAVFVGKDSKRHSGLLTASRINRPDGSIFKLVSFNLTSDHENKMEMFLDKSLRIEFLSNAMAEFFQRGKADIEAKSLPSFLYSCGSKDSDTIKRKLMKDDRAMTILMVGNNACNLQHKWVKDTEGKRMYAYIECFPLIGESEELRMHKDAIQRNKEFMEHTFHEVRNPLAVITGLTEEMEESLSESGVIVEDKKPFFNESMETMRLCLHSIMRTLNTTLSIEKMRAGETFLNMFSLNLMEVLKEMTDIYQSNAKAKKLSFCWAIDEPLVRQPIFSDMEKLMEITRNYLGNAMKYTNSGYVELKFMLLNSDFERLVHDKRRVKVGGYIQPRSQHQSCSTCLRNKLEDLDMEVPEGVFSVEASDTSFEFEEGKQYHLRIEVEDSGMGLEEEEMKQLFVRYAQIRAGEMQKGKGTGLGLNLCKTNAEMLGGSVGVHSRRGNGSVFFAIVPLFFSEASIPDTILERCDRKSLNGKSDDDDEEEDESSSKRTNDTEEWHKHRVFERVPFSEGRVIMCEDMSSLRKMMIRRLEKLGLEVIEMEDGIEIVEYFEKHGSEHKIDLVLTDEEMPQKNGSVALMEIRSMGIDIPVVMVTGNAMEHQRMMFHERRADSVLAKPCQPDVLKAELDKYFSE